MLNWTSLRLKSPHFLQIRGFPIPFTPCLSTELEGPSLSINETFIISVTHSVVGLTADISSENANDMGRSHDGKILLATKQHWFHISEETIYDQVCIYYISATGLNQREEGCFQNLGLAQFFGSTKLRYLQVKCEFLFQSGCLDVDLFESEILP